MLQGPFHHSEHRIMPDAAAAARRDAMLGVVKRAPISHPTGTAAAAAAAAVPQRAWNAAATPAFTPAAAPAATSAATPASTPAAAAPAEIGGRRSACSLQASAWDVAALAA